MLNHNQHRPTVGILYPGAMGASLGKLLVEHGFPVVTTLEGRSERTCRMCTEANLNRLRCFEDVVGQSEIVISLVPPMAAVEVAERFCDVAAKLAHPPLYVEANSISPRTAAEIESQVASCGARFLDAAIHGLASRLADHGVMYLSGPDAAEFAATLQVVITVKILGDKPGTASLFKMLQSAVAKGLVGVLLEICLSAREAGLLDELLEVCGQSYPGVMEVMERMLPTLPRHARRRAAEMREVEHTVDWLGLRPGIVREIRRLFGLLADSDLPQCADAMDLDAMSVADLLELIASKVSLRRDAAACAYASTTSS